MIMMVVGFTTTCAISAYHLVISSPVHDEVYSIIRPTHFSWFVGLLMGFNATFNNISVISWQSVLFVEETRVPRENHQPVTSH